MTAFFKLFQHFPKSYLRILALLCLTMLMFGLWARFNAPSTLDAQLSRSLDLSLKLPLTHAPAPDLLRAPQ